MKDELRDGVPCGHFGCLNHISHPCEECGRIGGRANKIELKKAIDEARANYNSLNIDQHYEMRCDRCVKRQKELDDTVISIAFAELEKKDKEIEEKDCINKTNQQFMSEGSDTIIKLHNRIKELEQELKVEKKYSENHDIEIEEQYNRIAQLEQAIDKAGVEQNDIS